MLAIGLDLLRSHVKVVPLVCEDAMKKENRVSPNDHYKEKRDDAAYDARSEGRPVLAVHRRLVLAEGDSSQALR